MALNTLEITTISRGVAVCKKILDLAEELHQLNDLYESGAGSVKAGITQENIDLATQYSGLTKTQLDDGFYAAETAVRTAIEGSRAQLTKLASRSS